jgi:hypothetical protein
MASDLSVVAPVGVLLCAPPPLVHTQGDDDEVLRREQQDHLARWPALQVMAEALTALRASGAPWWASAQLVARWPVAERLAWLEQRPDRRAAIVGSLVGRELREPRRRTVAFQTELLDAVVDPALDARRLDDAFDVRDLVTYGPVGEMWDEAMRHIPWEAEIAPPIVEQLLGILLADRSTLFAVPRPPVLSAWKLRSAIDVRAWQLHLPARVRAAVDEARLHKELVDPVAPFTARDELAIVTPAVLASSLPLGALRGVFTAAARVLGFEVLPPRQSQPVPKGDLGEPANDAAPPGESGEGPEARGPDAEITLSTA